jgi:hypothetical protein
MVDLLVKLYDIPDTTPVMVHMLTQGVEIRRPWAGEMEQVVSWVNHHFGLRAASECRVAFARVPVSSFIAVAEGKLLGYAVYDVIRRGIFGSMGVLPDFQDYEIDRALLLNSLHSMWHEGYGYVAITGVTDELLSFYQTVARAVPISNSTPGLMAGLLDEEII